MADWLKILDRDPVFTVFTGWARAAIRGILQWMPFLPDDPVVCYLEIDDVLHRATRDQCTAAAKVLASLHRRNVAVVLCSGATRGELDYLTRKLGVWHPFIAEDGSALCAPHGYFGRPLEGAESGVFWDIVDFGRTRRAVTDTIDAVAQRLQLRIVRLGELTVARAMASFGYSRALAARAIKRSYGDAVRVVDGSDFSRARLIRALQAEGLRCTARGEAIYAVSSRAGNQALTTVHRLFQQSVTGLQAIGAVGPDATGLVASLVETIDLDAATLPDAFEAVGHLAAERQARGVAPLVLPDRWPKYPVLAR